MSRTPLKFWTVICLLVLRLVMGGAAHAMPHEPSHVVDDTVVEHCAKHAQQADAVDAPADHDPGCCKHGACECPCPQAPCAFAVSMMSRALISTAFAPSDSVGTTGERVAALLRPPA